MGWAQIRRAAAAILIRATAAACAAGAVSAGPSPAAAQADPYRQHMDNGVKLFQDGNYEAALAEFEAAYRARPKASPLLNIALSQKALFRYAKAIGALERALAQHRDTMDASDIRSAEQAIQEMRALLARIEVEVTPPQATLIVDGEEQPPSAEGRWTLDLGPGQHRIAARAEGHAPAEESVALVSGQRDRTLRLALTPDKGFVTIDAGDPQIAISVDQQVMGHGRWSGYLAPGAHVVQMTRPSGGTYSAQILVAAGKAQEVRPGPGGVPATPATTTPLPPPPPPPPRSAPIKPAQRGVYLLASASLLWPLGRPEGFPAADANSGGAGALRAGYRVNNTAAFDVMLQYMNVTIEANATDPAIGRAPRYTFETGRLGANLRLLSPGELLRVTGSVGGGVSYDSIRFNGAQCTGCFDADGFDPFIFADLGVELDFGGPLVGLALEGYFQSARGVDAGVDDDEDVFAPRALLHLGGSLRVGYAFW